MHSKLPRFNLVARTTIETTDGLTGFYRFNVYAEGNTIVASLIRLKEAVDKAGGRVLTIPQVFHAKGMSKVQNQKQVAAFAENHNMVPLRRRKAR